LLLAAVVSRRYGGWLGGLAITVTPGSRNCTG